MNILFFLVLFSFFLASEGLEVVFEDRLEHKRSAGLGQSGSHTNVPVNMIADGKVPGLEKYSFAGYWPNQPVLRMEAWR